MSPGGGELVMEDVRANGFGVWTGDRRARSEYRGSLRAADACGGDSAGPVALSPTFENPAAPLGSEELHGLAEMLSDLYDEVAVLGDDEVAHKSAERLTTLISTVSKHLSGLPEGGKYHPFRSGDSFDMEFLSHPSAEFLIPQHVGPRIAGCDLGDLSHSASLPIKNPQCARVGSTPYSRRLECPEENSATPGAMSSRPALSMDLGRSTLLLQTPVRSGHTGISLKRNVSPSGEYLWSACASANVVQSPAWSRNGVSSIARRHPFRRLKAGPVTKRPTSAPRPKTPPTKGQIARPPRGHESLGAGEPERGVSRKRQRLSLFKLIERCNKARRPARPPTDRVLLPKQDVPLAAPSTPINRKPVALDSLVSSLPMSDTSPGSVDTDLVRLIQQDVEGGAIPQLDCLW